MPLPSKLKHEIDEIISQGENKQSTLIPVLRAVQNHFGWISSESMEEVAKRLSLPPSNVQNVVSFYTMFFSNPVGKHIIWQCRTLSCALRGAEQLEQYLTEKLNIKAGETTEDGKITLMEAECLASCGTAPAMLIDDNLYENVTKDKVDEIIYKLRKD